MEIYITYLLQMLSFPSRFKQFEMKNVVRRPTMGPTTFMIRSPPPQNFFHFSGPDMVQFLLLLHAKQLYVLCIVETWNFMERDFSKDLTHQKSSI